MKIPVKTEEIANVELEYFTKHGSDLNKTYALKRGGLSVYYKIYC